jgi:hypothetical protein
MWSIVNKTERTLILKCPYTETLFRDEHPYKYREFTLAPNASAVVCKGHANVNLFYDFYHRTSANRYGQDVYWQILSEDGTVLKTWSYSDIGLPGQKFFEESSWSFHHYWEWGIKDSWLFRIRPEDIVNP